MSKPSNYFVRVYHFATDDGDDYEDNFDMGSRDEALGQAKDCRKLGKPAHAFECKNILIPEDVQKLGIFDTPAYLWDWDEVCLDRDEE